MNDSDFKKISDLITLYNLAHPEGPDSIAAAALSAKHEQDELRMMGAVNKDTGIINKNESGRRLSISMPTALFMILRHDYPHLFTRDLHWLKRKFPMFVQNR